MAFVFEKVSAEKGQELCDKYHFMQQRDVPVVPRYWTIDRERNAFLVGERAGNPNIGPDTDRALMIWNEEPIEVEYIALPSSESAIGISIKAIRILPELGDKQDEVVELVKEALIAEASMIGENQSQYRKSLSYEIRELPESLALYRPEERAQ